MTEIHGIGPTVGLALIARNEQANLPRLLASIEGAFDRVVLVDTGSDDETKGLFLAWAGQQPGLTYSVADFEWINDFAAARNAADQLLVYGSVGHPDGNAERMVDWTSWADCDDTIRHPEMLRTLAANADAQVAGYLMGYEYAYSQGRVTCHLRRERLLLAELAGHWHGRVHEAQAINPEITGGRGLVSVPDDVVCWEHHKHDDPENAAEASAVSNERNLAILEAWNDDEPNDSRVLGYLGTETLSQGNVDDAIAYFQQYLVLKTGWDEERAQIHRKLSQAYITKGDIAAAEQSALTALSLLPQWPDSYLTLAEVAIHRQEWAKATVWAERAQEQGQPETLLIVFPLDYTFRPRMYRAVAAGESGEFDKAVTLAEEALQYGDEEQLRHGWMRWRHQAKRQHTANTFVMMAQQLVAHDEQLKALQVLGAVPVFAIDHPDVVACRSWVRERLRWAVSTDAVADYYNDASRPEDFIADDDLERLGDALPRVQFLCGGLREQLAA